MLSVLLTNDDGIQSPGIRQLALRLACKCRVTVVAPSTPSSATSHSITLHKPLRLIPARGLGYELVEGPGEIRAFHCSGTPSDCVMLGVMHLHKAAKPDLVISGINNGINVAQDLTYSGTVGGALEGAILGVPSLAVSLDYKRGGAGFDNAALLTDVVISILLYGKLPSGLGSGFPTWIGSSLAERQGLWPAPDAGLNDGILDAPGRWWPEDMAEIPCLNINLPDLPSEELQGVYWTFGGSREYVDVIQESKDPRGRPYYWIGGEKVLTDNDLPGCDLWALKRRLISVTPMKYDITSAQQLEQFRLQSRERRPAGEGQ